MTDRHKGYIVTLRDDTREDDAEASVTSRGMVKGVLSGNPIQQDAGGLVSDVRAWHKMTDGMFELIRGKKP